MKLSSVEQKALELKEFREAIGVPLDRLMARRIWGDGIGEELLRNLPSDFEQSITVKRKLKLAEELIKPILTSRLIKFIGVSGSVGVGSAKEEDDIDLFIVVANFTSWYFRLYSKLKFGSKIVWYGQSDQKDKLCLNYICEERAIQFQNHDLFILNEIYSLKPLYNPSYLSLIIGQNSWLAEEFYAVLPDNPLFLYEKFKFRDFFFLIVNIALFIPQVIYMVIRGHKPNLTRLLSGLYRGEIQFYPEQFRREKLEPFSQNTKDTSLRIE